MSADYWQETFEIVADDIGLTYTPEQAAQIGEAMKCSYDIYATKDREWKQKYDKLKEEFDKYQNNAEEAIRRKFKIHKSVGVSIGDYGSVTSYEGTINQLQ